MTSEDQSKRDGGRTRVLMFAKLLAPDGVQTVRVCDISPSGARVAAKMDLSNGGDVIFKRGGLFAAARITWTEGKQTGLKFYRKLSADELASIGNRTGRPEVPLDDAFAA